MYIRKRYSRFFVSLTVFELLAFDIWLPGGHEIWRDCWCDVTAQARITKFCTLIELIKRNIFYHYVIALSLVLWLPEVKKLIFGQKRDFQWRRLWRQKTTAARILKFVMMIHLNEYYISLHYTESLSLIVWVPERKNWYFRPKIDENLEKSAIFGVASRGHFSSWTTGSTCVG